MQVRPDHHGAGGAALVWRVPPGWTALSSASVGGGPGRPRWVTNLGVGDDFTRTDLPAYAAERAAALGLRGPGTTLLTAADVTQVEHAEHDGVRAWATVGVTKPTWALAPDGRPPTDPGLPPPPGTINIVVTLPRPLSGSALVQAVGTLTEAKAQALLEAGVPGTGTASDAVVVLCPPHEVGRADTPPEAFAGVRSRWGQSVAVAVHAAVSAGMRARPWPAADVDAGVRW
ncbi:adenosylcobinamide amidohydrolase [Ornithinimicrobium sp. LYQ92]|uniref:adenosylcobinamide amidohydrolase n=1 Tax=Serinicoccus sp. LYQ92 TaxID=3378798 RepID=UPI0038549F6C